MDDKKPIVAIAGEGSFAGKRAMAMMFAMDAIMQPVERPRSPSGCQYSVNGKCTKRLGMCDGHKRCRKRVKK